MRVFLLIITLIFVAGSGFCQDEFSYLYYGKGEFYKNCANNKCGVYHNLNYEIIPRVYDDVIWSNEFAGNIQFVIAVKNGKYGLINIKNEILIPFEYDKISFGEESLVPSFILEKNGKYSFVYIKSKDRYSKEVSGENLEVVTVIPAGRYQKILPTDKMDIYIFEQNNKYGLFNIEYDTGKFEKLIEPKYESITPLIKHYYVGKINDKCYTLDLNTRKNQVSEYEMTQQIRKTYNIKAHNYFILNKNGKLSIADENLKPLTDYQYENIEPILNLGVVGNGFKLDDTYAVIVKPNKLNFFKTKEEAENWVKENYKKYHDSTVEEIKKDQIKVEKDNEKETKKQKEITTLQKEAIQEAKKQGYKDYKEIPNGGIFIKTGDKYGYINTKYNVNLAPEYDYIYSPKCAEGYLFLRKNGKYASYNLKTKKFTAFKYADIRIDEIGIVGTTEFTSETRYYYPLYKFSYKMGQTKFYTFLIAIGIINPIGAIMGLANTSGQEYCGMELEYASNF